MKNILLFAGTTEGRLLAEFLIHQPVRLHTAVATSYGASLLPSAPSMTVSSHRMNEAQIIDFIQQQHFDLVLDATHPYASEASANISGACASTQVPYLRILRDCQTSADTSSNSIHPSEIFVDTTAEAVDCLNHQEGPVFLTTGSKTLPDFMEISNASDRVFVRILPNAEMLAACMSLGLPASHIFCMQGPFDVGMNTARHCSIINDFSTEYARSGAHSRSSALTGSLPCPRWWSARSPSRQPCGCLRCGAWREYRIFP